MNPQGNGNGGMYQASDGKWYPVEHMPQGWQQQPSYGAQPQMQYGQQPYGQGQPIIVQQNRPQGGGGAGAAAGLGCLAALCATCLCVDCLF